MTRPPVTRLGLETTNVARTARFYTDRFRLVPVRYDQRCVAFTVGGTELRFRRPSAGDADGDTAGDADRDATGDADGTTDTASDADGNAAQDSQAATPPNRAVPRGGVHVHYALTAPAVEYPRWRARFPDAQEVSFGDSRSIYPFDPDGHCPEIAGFGDSGTGLTGVFEVVLEVTDLDRAETAYTALGFEPIDRGSERRRVRLRGPAGHPESFDLELWEPQLGLAGARGGCHVELGICLPDPLARARAAFGDEPRAQLFTLDGTPTDGDTTDDTAITESETSVIVLDPDGHYLRLDPL